MSEFNWENVFDIPTEKEIAEYINPDKSRAPCVSGWLMTQAGARYTEYAVEFRCSHVPQGTYCCLGNWTMDHSALKKKYKNVWTEYNGVHGYAGFQSIDNGERVGIMSFWDVYCEDENGAVIKIRARRTYPAVTDKSEDFGGEGTGAHCLAPYNWQKDKWYRMHLRCAKSDKTGNTTVEQWVCDVETGKYSLLCIYDLGFEDSAFVGNTAIFLENYLWKEAGKVRSMEVRKAMYRDADTQVWKVFDSIKMYSRGGELKFSGSYNFGVLNGKIWMITSGVGGDWYNNGRGKKITVYKL